MQNKLSQSVLTLAQGIFKNPLIQPSVESAHVALLLVHVAWNRSLGDSGPFSNYKNILSTFEKMNPNLWNEFVDNNELKLINQLIIQKRQFFPNDKRIIKVCGMRNANVHVEWAD